MHDGFNCIVSGDPYNGARKYYLQSAPNPKDLSLSFHCEMQRIGQWRVSSDSNQEEGVCA